MGRSFVQGSPAECACVRACVRVCGVFELDQMQQYPSTTTMIRQKEVTLRKKELMSELMLYVKVVSLFKE
jgi:hypothetical protein